MIDCLVTGDDIALQVGIHLKECQVVVQSNLNSENYFKYFANETNSQNSLERSHVFSIGQFDPIDMETKSNLEKIRKNIVGKVIWLNNTKNSSAKLAVLEIASEYNDVIIDLSKYEFISESYLLTGQSSKKVAEDIKIQLYKNSQSK